MLKQRLPFASAIAHLEALVVDGIRGICVDIIVEQGVVAGAI